VQELQGYALGAMHLLSDVSLRENKMATDVEGKVLLVARIQIQYSLPLSARQ
jgi:hypothetical protein